MRRIIEFKHQDDLLKQKLVVLRSINTPRQSNLEKIAIYIAKHNLDGVVEDAIKINQDIQSKFCLTRGMLDKYIRVLKEQGIIIRVGYCYIVHPMLKQSKTPSSDEFMFRLKKITEV